MMVFCERPGAETQTLPAASSSACRPIAASFSANHARARCQTGLHATRWAPWSFDVSAASSRSSPNDARSVRHGREDTADRDSGRVKGQPIWQYTCLIRRLLSMGKIKSGG